MQIEYVAEQTYIQIEYVAEHTYIQIEHVVTHISLYNNVEFKYVIVFKESLIINLAQTSVGNKINLISFPQLYYSNGSFESLN